MAFPNLSLTRKWGKKWSNIFLILHLHSYKWNRKCLLSCWSIVFPCFNNCWIRIMYEHALSRIFVDLCAKVNTKITFASDVKRKGGRKKGNKQRHNYLIVDFVMCQWTLQFIFKSKMYRNVINMNRNKCFLSFFKCHCLAILIVVPGKWLL